MTKALGVDIGGTGIKAAVVDSANGELLTERVKLATPKGAEPDAVVRTVLEVIDRVGGLEAGVPVGVCVPSVVKGGRTLTAANIAEKWVGLEAEALFERSLGRNISFINDADAAGHAEMQYGAAKDAHGVVILTTLGTGIGSALLYNGVLVPNTELGHLRMKGESAEVHTSALAREREGLSWKKWAVRLQRYYDHVERLFAPDLIVVGGGVSKNADKFLPLLSTTAPIVPATLRNNAGIIGAASLAAAGFHT